MISKQHQGLLFVLSSATAYAVLPIITKNLYQLSELTPTDISLWRYILAAPMIWAIVWLRPVPAAVRQDHLPLLPLLGLGIVYAIAVLTAFFGLALLSASTYVVLFYTYPTMVALLGVMLGERLSKAGWVALIMTGVGILLTIPDFSALGGGDWLGIVIALVNALSVALYFLLSGRVLRGHSAVARGTAWVVTGTLLTLLILVPFTGLYVSSSLEVWLNLLMLALISTAFPIFALNIGIQMIGAPRSAIVSSVQPVQTMVMAMLLLGEVIMPMQWGGALLIVAAVVLLQTRRERPIQAVQPTAQEHYELFETAAEAESHRARLVQDRVPQIEKML
jgi:drug/metabolite transporter (DMT)-like permease